MLFRITVNLSAKLKRNKVSLYFYGVIIQSGFFVTLNVQLVSLCGHGLDQMLVNI